MREKEREKRVSEREKTWKGFSLFYLVLGLVSGLMNLVPQK